MFSMTFVYAMTVSLMESIQEDIFRRIRNRAGEKNNLKTYRRISTYTKRFPETTNKMCGKQEVQVYGERNINQGNNNERVQYQQYYICQIREPDNAENSYIDRHKTKKQHQPYSLQLLKKLGQQDGDTENGLCGRWGAYIRGRGQPTPITIQVLKLDYNYLRQLDKITQNRLKS